MTRVLAATAALVISLVALAIGAGANLTALNTPPDEPVLVAPDHGATEVSTSPALQVSVADVDAGTVEVTFYGREVGAVGDPFTFVALPDTQHYVDHATDHLLFGAQTQWIVDDPLGLDIAFVAHLGDIVENWNSLTEWNRADSHLNTVDTSGVPLAISPGNHDLDLSTGGGSFYDTTFPPSRFAGQVWYGGYLGDNQFGTDPIDRQWKNNYELFSAGGMDFVSIALDYGMPQDSLDWAKKVLDAYPDRHAVISTHAFLNTSGVRPSSISPAVATGATSAQHAWDTLITKHCNVFLVVNGHYPGEARLTSDNDCGRPVHQLVSDYQNRPNGGDGWLRFMTFDPANSDIDVFTYSPTRNAGAGEFETDGTSQFNLLFDMSESGYTQIDSLTVVPGTIASVPWPARDENSAYEWFVVVDDGVAEVRSDVWSFTTGAEPPGPTCSGLVPTIDMSLGASGMGTPGADVILGTSGPDVISGFGGDDTICGLGGADVINGGNGFDTIFGGDGDDTIGGQGDADTLHGEGDNDRLNGGVGDDLMFGGPGEDDLRGQGNNDTMNGGDGVDQFFGGSGNDIINTGDGGNLGTGMVVRGGGNNDIITGSPQDDDLEGISGLDELFGEGGNDRLRGGNGLDMLFGGPGQDTLEGGANRDFLFGGEGDDMLSGGTGNDDLFGESGDDALNGQGGTDLCDGGTAGETLGDTATPTCETLVDVP